MAAIADTVRPGDVISSDLMARIIALLNAHEAALGGGSGGLIVPNLFGRTLAEARVIVQHQQLQLGSVVDVFGTIIDAQATGSAALMVLSQVPVAGLGTIANAAVSLVVAGPSGGSGGGPGPLTPDITSLVQVSARANETIEIRGSGFAGVTSTVTFNGISGAVLSTSNQTRLFVTVPSGIPGAPSLPGDPALPGVTVRATNPNGLFDNGSITISPPLASPLAITGIPGAATVGSAMTINGTGFSTTANQNVVTFGGVTAAAPTTATAIRLTVTVPTGIPGLVVPGDSTTVNVRVRRTTDNAVSNDFPKTVDL